jgi:8-amino-7-oxononanoate synthase
MAQGLRDMGYDLGASATPILPVTVGEDVKCLQMCRRLQDEGIFVNPVLSPAVEVGHAILRVSLMATHSFEQIDRALEQFRRVGKRLGILTPSGELHDRP